MQTFLPYPDIIKSVQCLDNKRLGKQRVEAYQILRTLNGLSKGWINHPIVKMWHGFNSCLEVYMNECIREWIRRGFNNTMLFCVCKEREALIYREREIVPNDYPNWFGNKDFHDSHKSNLLRKDKEFYSKYNWNVPDNLSYIWPI